MAPSMNLGRNIDRKPFGLPAHVSPAILRPVSAVHAYVRSATFGAAVTMHERGETNAALPEAGWILRHGPVTNLMLGLVDEWVRRSQHVITTDDVWEAVS